MITRKKKPLKRSPIKRKVKTIPKEIKDHWQRVAKLGCIVTFDNMATIHHVHGGSIRARFGKKAMPGMGQRQNHWLVIPLHPRLHTGRDGIDMSGGVAAWEAKYGTQLSYLDKVRQMIQRQWGYDIYEKAGLL